MLCVAPRKLTKRLQKDVVLMTKRLVRIAFVIR